MHLRGCCLAVLLLSSFAVFVDSAEAQRRGRGNYYYSGGSLAVAPYSQKLYDSYKVLPVYYNYNRANDRRNAYLDKLRVFLAIPENNELSKEESLVAEVHYTDLENYTKPKLRYYELKNDGEALRGYKNFVFEITNDNEKEPIVEHAHVYRMFINLHRKADKYDKTTLIGRVPLPYYAATSGKSTLELARQQIVMRTFKEFYYINRGWDSGERYTMDCYAYYMWATGFCTKGAAGGHTQLWTLFPNGVGNHNGWDVPDLVKKAPVHADYVRIPGHSFMILAYDPHVQHVWTMEGNFGATVEVAIRTIDGSWSVGHLKEEHVRAELFPRQKPKVPSMMASETMSMFDEYDD
ncbi:MAG: hypothetical protein MI757_15535 [Pirellulales bacterium]|nr:hypothetical protein [Pirellulales bacterium]